MKRVLALLLCAVTLVGLSACKKEEQAITIPTASNTTTTTATTEEVPVVYAHNEIINRFFVRYSEMYRVGKLDTDTICRGKDVNEYTATIAGCSVTITDVSKKDYPSGVRYALQFEIVGGTTDQSLDQLMDAFATVATAMDSNCTTATAENVIYNLRERTEPLSTTAKVSKNVSLAYYTPVIKNEYTTQPCRISLLTLDDIVTDAATATSTTSTTAN